MDNQIAACLFLFLPFGRFGLLHFNPSQKGEVTNAQEEEGTLEMPLSPERSGGNGIVLSQPWKHQQALTLILPLMSTGRGKGLLAGGAMRGRSFLAEKG